MSSSLIIAILLLCSYLLGSCPFGLWLVWIWKGVDIREIGSGNIGATNVSRVCGRYAGWLIFTLDLLKGLLPPLIVGQLHLASHWQMLSAFLTIIGHIYPIWIGFKGGKGISTSGGALLGAAPLSMISSSVVWIIAFLFTRVISLSSIICAVALPVFIILWYRGDYPRLLFGVLAASLAIYKHRANIQRILAGTEPKTTLFKQKKTTISPESTVNQPLSEDVPYADK